MMNAAQPGFGTFISYISKPMRDLTLSTSNILHSPTKIVDIAAVTITAVLIGEILNDVMILLAFKKVQR